MVGVFFNSFHLCITSCIFVHLFPFLSVCTFIYNGKLCLGLISLMNILSNPLAKPDEGKKNRVSFLEICLYLMCYEYNIIENGNIF